MNVELIGCGGSAHHIITPLAQLLALNGTNRLRLWDGDTFEERNTSRQFLALGRLGQNKADAMGEYISSIVPSLNISAEDVYFYFDLAREELEANQSSSALQTTTKQGNKLCLPSTISAGYSSHQEVMDGRVRDGYTIGTSAILTVIRSRYGRTC